MLRNMINYQAAQKRTVKVGKYYKIRFIQCMHIFAIPWTWIPAPSDPVRPGSQAPFRIPGQKNGSRSTRAEGPENGTWEAGAHCPPLLCARSGRSPLVTHKRRNDKGKIKTRCREKRDSQRKKMAGAKHRNGDAREQQESPSRPKRPRGDSLSKCSSGSGGNQRALAEHLSVAPSLHPIIYFLFAVLFSCILSLLSELLKD